VNNAKLILNTILIPSLLLSGTGLSFYDAPISAAANSSSAPSITTKVDLLREVELIPLWQDKTNGMGVYDTEAPFSNGLVYYSPSGSLKAVDIVTGKVKWSYKNGTHPEIVTNNSVFFSLMMDI